MTLAKNHRGQLDRPLKRTSTSSDNLHFAPVRRHPRVIRITIFHGETYNVNDML